MNTLLRAAQTSVKGVGSGRVEFGGHIVHF